MSREQTVDALVKARLSGEKLGGYPGEVPASIAEAYDMQDAAAKLMGWKQIGWKIGCTSESVQKALGADGPFPGPVYAERFFASGSHVPTKPGNSRTTEPEIAFRMARSLPPRSAEYGVDEVLDAVECFFPSIEVVNPRLPGGFSDSMKWFIADGALNDDLVLGPALEPLRRDDYGKILVKAYVNGKLVSEGVGANALGGPEKALTWLQNHLSKRGRGLNAGDVVTTGVVTGIFESNLGDEVRVEHVGHGEVMLKF